MSIHVTDFKWEKGNNDLQYIELLEKTLKNEQAITAKAVAKIRELSVENSELHNEAQAERAFLTERDAEIRAKTIDEFASAILQKFTEEGRNGNYRFYSCKIKQVITDLAEQLKGGGV